MKIIIYYFELTNEGEDDALAILSNKVNNNLLSKKTEVEFKGKNGKTYEIVSLFIENLFIFE